MLDRSAQPSGRSGGMRQVLSTTDGFSVKFDYQQQAFAASKEVAYLRLTPCTPPLRYAVSLAVTS